MTDRTDTLDLDSVRQMVRLLGDIAGSNADAVARRRALMDGLVELVDADGWLWTMTHVDDAERTPVSMGVIHGGLSDEQFAAWLESSQANDPPLPENDALFALCAAGEHFTRRRQDLVTDEAWYANRTVKRFRLDVGLDHFLYTIYPLRSTDHSLRSADDSRRSTQTISAIGLYRKTGRPPFSPRDQKIAHILTSEIEWLHTASLPKPDAHAAPTLSRRLRTVLILLLDGHGRKSISRLLTISEHTAKDHIDAVYRHFKVSSQVELMKRFATGTQLESAK